MSPIFTAQDGRVYRRGIFMLAEDAGRLLARFRRIAADRTDWFRHDANILADELQAAMTAAGIIQTKQEAA